MTITRGARYTIPRGTEVYDHKRKRRSLRRVSYPVHVENVVDGRVYWFGDCNRLMSCADSAVDLTCNVTGRCPRCGARERRRAATTSRRRRS